MINKSKLLESFMVIFVLMLAIAMRFYSLRLYPGWYSDEGSFLDVARNWAEGRWQYFAIRGSPLLIGRPPLFFIILGEAFRVFRADILTGRVLCAIYGVLMVFIVYLFGRRISNPLVGWIAAMFLAIYPWAVIYHRTIFTYNQLALFGLFSLYAVWRYVDEGSHYWGALASLSAGAGLATDYLGIVYTGLLVLVVFVYQRKWLVMSGIFMVVPVLMAMLPVLLVDPSGMFADLRYTFTRVEVPLAHQLINTFIYFTELLRREVWLTIGLLGLFLIPERRARWMTMFVSFTTILLVVRSLPPIGRNYHHLIQLFPLISIGVGAFLYFAIKKLYEEIDGFLSASQKIIGLNKNSRSAIVYSILRTTIFSFFSLVLLASPMIWMVFVDIDGIQTGNFGLLFRENDHNLAEAEDVQEIFAFLNGEISAEDLVIASPHIVWLLPSMKADFAQSIAFSEGNAGVLPNIKRSRFAYDCSLSAAKFVVIDPLATDYAPQLVPDMKSITQALEGWPIVFHRDGYVIFQNPSY